MMYRKFIATVLATAVAVVGLSAAPARADGEDVLKILGGIAAIAAISSAIDDYDRKNDRVSRGFQRYDNHYHNNVRRNHGYGYGHRHKHHTHRHKHKHKHYKHHKHHAENRYHYQDGRRYRDDSVRPLPGRVQRKLLPGGCRVWARNKRGTFVAFTEWCLKRNYGFARSLPQKCATRARILSNNNRNTVYGVNCLARHGYGVEGH